MTKGRGLLNNNQLKIIAIISMLIDHIGVELLPQYEILRIIGRVSFPIFAYMIAEGCHYTRNRAKYFFMVFGLGVICQSVYLIAMGSWYQNVLMTFALSILIIYALDSYRDKCSVPTAGLLVLAVLTAVFLCLVLPEYTDSDFHINYGVFGVLMPVMIYVAPDKWAKLAAAAAVIVAHAFSLGGNQWFALIALPLLALYNGKRGKLNLKYLFYIFYPTHLVIIYGISLLMG